MTKEHVLIVEDEEDILELIKYNLTNANFRVTGTASAEEALVAIYKEVPNLIILDIMLPGMDGLEFCKTLKSDPTTQNIPILMVSAKGEENDIVHGLEIGSEDYITKPFSPKVLVARVNKVLKRKEKEVPCEKDVIKLNDLVIHPGRHEVLLNGQSLSLTRTEFQVLHFLARRPGWVFTRYQIVDNVKGEDYPVTDRAIDVTIVGLRKKLKEHSDLIETVRGVGYRFKE